jgi:hypothetical protein
MNKRMSALKAFLRGVARVQKSFTIQIGPVRATGVPAILLGVSGLVLATGLTNALNKSANRLPETLGEARGLAEAIGGGSRRLKS